MKPTLTANLSGTEFIFDNDAFALLEQYLRSLREAFNARQLDTNELLADIEARCAEILSEPRPDGSRIVTISLVRDLIDRMGQPQEIFDDDSTTPPPVPASEASPAVTATPPPIRKRFYRDPQTKLIGGVCSGLAIYSGWDPVWVRLATVGLAFLSFSTVTIIYIILWIVIRPAVTPYQQMQLRGVSPTLQNIGHAVTGTFRSVKNYIAHPAEPTPIHDNDCEFEELLPDSKQQKTTGAKRYAQIINKTASVIFKVLLILFGLVCIPALIGSVTALMVMITIPESYMIQIANDISDPMSVSIFTNIPIMMWILISGIIFFAIPAISMIWMVCRMFMGRRAKPVPLAPKITMLVIWLGSIFSLIICGEVLNILPFL